jgi:glycosyltransferase involved in cell wall biosynthesis
MQLDAGASIPVSVIIMTKNEETDLPICLRALRDFDEVFVVDSESTDQTSAIAEAFGARLVSFSWNGRYPKKKQWCLDNLPFSHDWVFYVDADEQATPDLCSELADLVRGNPPHAAYFVRLDYVFLGRLLTHGHQMHKLSLLNRHHARFLEYDDLAAQRAGEVELHVQPTVSGTVGMLRGRLIHNDHDSLYSYWERQNRYTDWEALLRNKGGITREEEAAVGRTMLLKQLFQTLPGKPLLVFLHHYLFRRGFLDGRAGFHWAVDRALYHWQIGLKRRELRTGSARLEGAASPPPVHDEQRI